MDATSGQLPNVKETWDVNSAISHKVFSFQLCYKNRYRSKGPKVLTGTIICNSKEQIDAVQKRDNSNNVNYLFLSEIIDHRRFPGLKKETIPSSYAQTEVVLFVFKRTPVDHFLTSDVDQIKEACIISFAVTLHLNCKPSFIQ